MKKLLTLFVLLFAISLVGVACSDKNPDDDDIFGGGGGGEQQAVVLEAPSIVKDQNNNIFWAAVANATGYIVNVNGTDRAVQTANSFAQIPEVGTYTVKVKAKGDGENYLDSAYSNNIVYQTVNYYSVTKSESGKYVIQGNDKVVEGGTYTFTVTITSMYLGDYTVYVNGNLVTPVEGLYTVANVTGNISITVDDSNLEYQSQKITFVNNGANTTVNGASKVDYNGDYEFEVTTTGTNIAIVYFDGEIMQKQPSGKYLVENVTKDLTFTIEEYSINNEFAFTKGNLNAESTIKYYDSCWNAAIGDKEGMGLKGGSGSIFNLYYEQTLISGLNKIIEFSTQNTYGGDEVQSIDFILTDTETGKELIVNFQSCISINGSPHNSWITVYVNEEYKDANIDGYVFNFSNNVVDGVNYSQIPYIDFDTTTGRVICGGYSYTDATLVDFGTDGVKMSIKFNATQSTTRGILITKLFNKTIDLNKLFVNEVFGVGIETTKNYTFQGDGISITGTKAIGESDSVVRYYSDKGLTTGDNTLVQFLTTNNDNSKVTKLQMYFSDGVNTIRVRIWEGMQLSGDSGVKGAFVVGMYLNEVSIDPNGTDGFDTICNFQNTGVQAGSMYYEAPSVKLNTQTGLLSYGSISVQTDALIGFGAEELSIRIVFEGCEPGNGIVIGTACNQQLA